MKIVMAMILKNEIKRTICSYKLEQELLKVAKLLLKRSTLVADPNSHRLHNTAAVGFPVAGLDIHMETAEAVRAVVAVLGRCALRDHKASAEFAVEGFVAGMGLIIALFEGHTLILSVHTCTILVFS